MKSLLLVLLTCLFTFSTQAQINLATITENEVQQSWKIFFDKESETIETFSTYPWQELAELNIFAAKTWDMMRACEGSSKEEIERIKEKYKKNEAFCSPQININLKQLHDSFYSLVSTTYMKFGGHTSIIRHQNDSNYYRWPFAINHPLFIQVVTEVLSAVLRFYKLEDVYFSTLFEAKIDHVVNNNLGLSMGEYSTVKIIVNSAYILSAGPKKYCSHWGLWPKKSYVLTRSWRRGLFYLTFDITNIFISDNYCEMANEEQPQLKAKEVINFYRSLAKTYDHQVPNKRVCKARGFCHIEDPATPGEVTDYYKFMTDTKYKKDRWAKYDEFHSDHSHLVCGCPCMSAEDRMKKCLISNRMSFSGFMESFK